MAWLIAFTSALTLSVTWVLHTNHVRLFWGALILPAIVIIKWIPGVAWIRSPSCMPWVECDSGAIPAHTANTIVLFAIVLLTSVFSVVGYWLWNRR